MSEPPPRTAPFIGRRAVLQLLGVGAFGLVAACRSSKPQATPTSAGSATAPPSGSPQTRPASAASTKTPSPSPQPTISPLSADQLVAQRVALAEQALLAAYDAAAAAHPELAGRLAPFRADHAAHLGGLIPGATPSPALSPLSPPSSGAAIPASTPAPSNTPASSTSGAPTSASAPVLSPPASTEIFQQLAEVERNAAAARVDDLATTSGSLARLIASIGGCEAAHAALLSVAT